jgi:hypothetical protein
MSPFSFITMVRFAKCPETTHSLWPSTPDRGAQPTAGRHGADHP